MVIVLLFFMYSVLDIMFLFDSVSPSFAAFLLLLPYHASPLPCPSLKRLNIINIICLDQRIPVCID